MVAWTADWSGISGPTKEWYRFDYTFIDVRSPAHNERKPHHLTAFLSGSRNLAED